MRFWLFLCLPFFMQAQVVTGDIDPFIGTGGHGHSHPSASMPFGMVQLGPDSR
ncbi:MAG: hypothetical protein HN824_07380, partial [Flavobacteriales bacterium]|nr:hypothetical protein [Flavobacteriales bacterium]